jgi:hypothetical protein
MPEKKILTLRSDRPLESVRTPVSNGRECVNLLERRAATGAKRDREPAEWPDEIRIKCRPPSRGETGYNRVLSTCRFSPDDSPASHAA